MPINSQKNYCNLLESIYNNFSVENPFSAIFSDSKSISIISQRYQIDVDQVKILSYVSHFYPTRIVENKLASVIGLHIDSCMSKFDDLVNRNFLQRFIISDGIICYGMTDSCHEAFLHGSDYGKLLFNDCFHELMTAEDELFTSEDWKETLYESFSLPKNLHFKKACKILGIQQLDSDTQSSFWILVSFFMKRFTLPFSFRHDEMIINANYGDSITIKIGMGNLVKAGLAISLPIEPSEDLHDTERYVISPHVVQLLFHGRDELARYDEISKLTNVILAKDITEKKLFFSEASQVEVDNLKKVLSEDGFKRAESIMKRQHRNPAVQSLFWGPPGTGKTEVIKQIARETGRDILIYDAAKVTASAWGASEKNYRTLFLGYNYLVAICTKAPILLLNECDQILAKRITNMERAIDRSENTVSNILLQGFEDMSGILLATTNLATNLDSAFDRRFLFKTELTKPDAKARKCIWQSLVPELSESEAKTLAERFEMTGGQISNVVAKRELAELYYEGDRGLEYIAGLCKTEINDPTKITRSRKVGF